MDVRKNTEMLRSHFRRLLCLLVQTALKHQFVVVTPPTPASSSCSIAKEEIQLCWIKSSFQRKKQNKRRGRLQMQLSGAALLTGPIHLVTASSIQPVAPCNHFQVALIGLFL